MTAFAGACSLLEGALKGDARSIVYGRVDVEGLQNRVPEARDSMRAHSWAVGGSQITAAGSIKAFDGLTREDGFTR
jgi:hypothetical protein